MHRWICTFTAACAMAAAAAAAGDWPAFRGPNGNGLSDEKHAPLEWSKDRNIKWKAALPGPGNGSPIVSGERVFVTCAEDDGKKRGLYCFHRADGSPRWARIVDFDKLMPTHKTNPYLRHDAGNGWQTRGRVARFGRSVLLRHGRQGTVAP